MRPAWRPPPCLCERALRPCHRPAARDQVGDGLERGPAHRPLRRADQPGGRDCGARQPRQGRRWADDPVREPHARPRRSGGAWRDRNLSMSVTAAEGFVAAGLHAGIKRRKFDMAMIATDDGQPVACAAVFTQNKFAAPPVEMDRATLKANGGKAAAVIVNSGNAIAGTGRPGYKNAQLMAAATAEAHKLANSNSMVCSTGIIGTPLP